MIFGDLGCLGDLITRNARVFPNREGWVFEGKRFSWKEANQRVNRLANAILRLGLRPGDRLAILGKNSHRFLESFFAAAKTGIIAVKPNYRYRDRELGFILQDSEARGIIFDGEFSGMVRTLSGVLSHLTRFICTDQKVEGAIEYESLLEGSEPTEPPRDIQAQDLVMIQYTSGTTSSARGAMMTHGGQIALANNGAINLGRHRMLIPLPLFSAAATGRVLSHIYLGNTIVILKEFAPRLFLDMLQKERITYTGLIPSMFYLLMEGVPNLKDYDTRSLQHILYGGGPMTAGLLKVAMQIFENCGFEGGYGLTETGPYGSRLLPEEHKVEGSEKELSRLGSVGRMAINGLLKIVGGKGEDLPPGEIGEIAISCDSNMVGYWNRPEETAETLKGGWVFTGDLGVMDEEGYVFIKDRKKDLIISGGFNIFPREVEEVLMAHPGVLEAAVIGIPDDKWGESILAVVKMKEGHSVTQQDLIEHCRQNLASFKKPQRIEFVKEFPRTPTHKIQKFILREKYLAGGRRIN